MYRSAQNVGDMAEVLRNMEDADKYHAIAEKIKIIYDRYFIGEDGVIESGHQAAYVRVLAFDLVSEKKRPAVLHQLLKEIEKQCMRAVWRYTVCLGETGRWCTRRACIPSSPLGMDRE